MRSVNFVPTIFSPLSVPTMFLARATPLAKNIVGTAAITASNIVVPFSSPCFLPPVACSHLFRSHHFLQMQHVPSPAQARQSSREYTLNPGFLKHGVYLSECRAHSA